MNDANNTTTAAIHNTPADARRAASVLLLRDSDEGVEVLMLRRAERDGDLRSGAVVFPGGILDPRDRDAHDFVAGGDDRTLSTRLALPEGGLDYAIAALRETFEEVGLLLVQGTRDADALKPWRQRLQTGDCGIAEMCAALELRLDLHGWVYTSHWLTPPGLPKRFDTRFFAVRAPADQEAEADMGEAQELMWLTPRAALQPERGLKLMPVTQRTLHDLGRHATVDEALRAMAGRAEIPLIMPRRAIGSKGARVVLPDDHAYAEVARLDPEGRGDVCCQLLPGVPVRLSPRIWRVTAPNAGVMTGPGTNTYLVADPAGDAWTAIDPGPDDATHVQAILAALPGRLAQILVTHTHKDHSPAAAALSQATGATVLGRVADHPMWQDAGFAPARELQHGERLQLGPQTTLRVIHTPGHASNHLCYLLEEERTLFTGDHVMQGSTVVINPPDGDMQAYLRTLGELQREDLEWLAPGHGFLVARPHAVLAGLVAHRLRREAKVVAALQAAAGPVDIDALLPRVYDDVPTALHAVARRSLLAHLLKLQADGAAAAESEVWRLT